tara:strand:+ start:759 stop:1415 length:657 start_codon:yes stop_codon:yes gene_type:complete
MDLSFLHKYKFEENNKINIYGNFLIKDVINDITEDNLKYINYYNSNNSSKEIIEYYFLISLIQKNIEMLLDSPSILDGELINNKYNNYLPEENILLLFMKIKIFVFQKLNNLVQFDDCFQNIFDKKIIKYDNFLEHETQLLKKDLDIKIRKILIKKEILKVKIYQIEFYLILSFYFNNSTTHLLEFIDKVENITENYIKQNNLNDNLEIFWKHLITSI